MKTKVIVGTLLLMLAGGLIFVLFFASKKGKEVTLESLKNKEAKYEELIGVRYFSGGGMDGSVDSREVRRNEEGKLTVTLENSQENGFPSRYRIYEVDPALLDDLNEYVREYNLSVWDEFEEPDEYPLDAPSTSLTLLFQIEEKKYPGSITIDYDREFPEGAYQVLHSFMSRISEAVKNGKLSETYLEDEGHKIYTGKDIENSKEEITDLLSGYWRNENVRFFETDTDEYALLNFNGAERKEFLVKEIVREPFKDRNCSWHLLCENREDDQDRLYIAMEGYSLYICDDDGNELYLLNY